MASRLCRRGSLSCWVHGHASRVCTMSSTGWSHSGQPAGLSGRPLALHSFVGNVLLRTLHQNDTSLELRPRRYASKCGLCLALPYSWSVDLDAHSFLHLFCSWLDSHASIAAASAPAARLAWWSTLATAWDGSFPLLCSGIPASGAKASRRCPKRPRLAVRC